MGSTASVVLAAGSGARFGRPKQFELIEGISMVDRVISVARKETDFVVLVLPADHPRDEDGEIVWQGAECDVVIGGGSSHHASTQLGLDALPSYVGIVVITAASHPLASVQLYRESIAAVRSGAHAAAPAVRIADAIKRRQGDRLIASVDKSDLVMVQSPGAFDLAFLRKAFEDSTETAEEIEAVQRLGGHVVWVEGEPTNIHVTSPQELEIARRLAGLVS